jgi:DNA polymerase III epsilon subunit-like protein
MTTTTTAVSCNSTISRENISKEAKQRRQDTISSQLAAQYVALDCEMVGVGPDGKRSALARIAIVNFYGTLLYESFVKPPERITDFRTALTGISPAHLRSAKPLLEVLFEVDEFIKEKIIIGHGLENDFKVTPSTINFCPSSSIYII